VLRGIHEHPPDDPYWRRYITAMFELARLSAPEVARRLRLSGGACRILDAGGGHGWFAAELCRRNPRLSATVIDLPGSATIGREIISAVGLTDRVVHAEGDILTDDLRGPYDAALVFGVIHHLTPEQNQRLLCRVAESLNPGGLLAVLDMFEPEESRRPDTSAFLGLHFHLTSAAGTYRLEELRSWMSSARFAGLRAGRLRSNPLHTLVTCRKPKS
jgi:cyclopropane fatty-acyl-phospholipid synthase-like methyltransferase